MHPSTRPPIRRIFVALIIAICSLSFAPLRLYSQVCGGYGIPGTVTNLGTEFLLCFIENEAPGSDQTGNAYQDIYLASAGDTSTVVISCKAFPKLHKVIFLQKNEAIVYRISDDLNVSGRDVQLETDEIVDKTIISVLATTPIACYGLNNKQFTADAFLALPRSVASTEYCVMAYYNSLQGGPENMSSEFAVAAFEDSTQVTITPSALTKNGNDASKPLTFILNAGEGVQIQAFPDTPLLDMTGSTVESSKPVVVFGGSERTEIPSGYSYNESGNGRMSRDHLCEEIPPTSAWGFSFVTKNFGRDHGDIMRVLAWKNNTIVKINGKVWGAPLMKNTSRDYVFDFSNLADSNVISVESDSEHTILVGMFAHSAVDQPGTGDPFLAIVPSVNQTFNDYTYFITKDTINYDPTKQFLIVCAEQSVILNKISIDGSPLPAIAFTPVPVTQNGGKHYVAATINQPVGGLHRITTGDPAGFTILAYGWGNVVSYGYTAGGIYKPINGIMPKNQPDPGIVPGPGGSTPELPPPGITVRNIIMEKVYFDSARIRYDQNPHNISVRLKKDISSDIGTIESAQEKTLELTTSESVQDVIKGTVRIWYHSRMWTDMYPVDFPFTITPQAQADVKSGAGQAIVLENYPNPVSGRTTVHFSLSQRASVSVKIFDALGRMVYCVVQSAVNSGDHEYPVNTKGFTTGEYTLELLAPELGVIEHRKMIVIE